MEISRNEINEETRYVWECPECGYYNEFIDDPSDEEVIVCDKCCSDFNLKD